MLVVFSSNKPVSYKKEDENTLARVQSKGVFDFEQHNPFPAQSAISKTAFETSLLSKAGEHLEHGVVVRPLK